MPVKKTGRKWEVNKEVYDTEKEANKAYMAYLDSAFGIKRPKKKAPETEVVEE